VTRRPRPRSLVLFAALFAACGSNPPVPPPAPIPIPVEPAEPLFIQLDDAAVNAIAELLRMEDVRALDEALATRLLQSPTAEVRGRAALAVGRIHDRNGTPLLLRALQDSIRSVRVRAAFALGEMNDTSAAVIAALGAAALRTDAAEAPEAIAALGQLAVPAARATIDSLLRTTALPTELRHETLLAVWHLPAAAGTMPLVARWLTDTDAETRWRAAYSLGRIFGAAALPALLDASNDADARVRVNVVRALRAARADSAGVRERAFAAALAAAADSHPHVRITALRLLPAYGNAARTLPILTTRLRDSDENVAIAATQALGEAADRTTVDALYGVVIDPARSIGLRTFALAALLRTDTATAVRLATSWADSTRWLLRLHAARTLASGSWNDVGTVLQRLARDPHRLVAAAALTSVRTVAGPAVDLRLLYIEQLRSADPLVRAAAAGGLARRDAILDLDLLLEAYDRALRDSTNDAALATVDALTRAKRMGVPVDRSFFLRFPHAPRDAEVRRLIVDSIGRPPSNWSEPAPAEPRPLSFYVDVVRRLIAPTLAGTPPPHVTISTVRGDIELELAAADAPLTVLNFLTLVDRGYYNGSRWHRVVPNFVAQDGDPGSGGPGYSIRDEINQLRYVRGVLGMALGGPDTGGSQFFITHSAQPHLDGGYTIFGRVHAGLDVLDRIVQEDSIVVFRRGR
jgi:cyclophilin family peptidyl-prolyl cis-trans isomerase/HEAT repeat protein